MNQFYLITSYAAVTVSILATILLFLRHKENPRPRFTLGFISFFFMLTYVRHFSIYWNNESPTLTIDTPLLIWSIGFLSLRLLYPIEILRPKWLTPLNFLKIFTPIITTGILCYFIKSSTSYYQSYSSIAEVLLALPDINAILILLLTALYFSLILIIIHLYKTDKNKKLQREWFNKYIITLGITIVPFLFTLINYDLFFPFSYYISMLGNLYIVYLELFEQPNKPFTIDIDTDTSEHDIITGTYCSAAERNKKHIFESLESYMRNDKAYRDPDLNLSKLVRHLGTNRTTLTQIIQQQGYDSYSNYINKYRIDDFTQTVMQGKYDNFQNTFYDVGFKSRATAIRNFKYFKGSTPSEYFKDFERSEL